MKNVSKLIPAENMIAYLRSMMDDFMEEKERFGIEDRIVQKKMQAMIDCKNMVEALIGLPVNLQKDGKITIGF